MKRIFSLFVCAFMVLSLSAQSQSVGLDKLPAVSQQYLKSHFATQKIDNITHNHNSQHECYLVHFTDGNKVAFDAKTGDCVMIDMKSGTIPASMLPSGITSYLSTNDPKDGVKSFARTKCGWRVGLVSGKALCFDGQGNYQKMCDGKGCSDGSKKECEKRGCEGKGKYHGEPKAMHH